MIITKIDEKTEVGFRLDFPSRKAGIRFGKLKFPAVECYLRLGFPSHN